MASFNWAKGVSGDWNVAANWLEGAVPNDPTADVRTATAAAGSPGYKVTIGAGASDIVHSLDLNSDLEVDGTLTFAPGSTGALGYETGNSGLTMNNGTLVNAGLIFASIHTTGNVMFTGSNPIYMAWELQAVSGTATVDTASIGQYNAPQHILFDGIFDVMGASQTINLGGKLGGLAVDVETLTGPKAAVTQNYWTQFIYEGPGSQINEWNGASYVPIESTLKLIENAAYVTVTNGRDYTTANALTIGKDGVFEQAGGTLSTGGLTLLSGGLLVGGISTTGTSASTGRVTVNGAVTNNGQIVAEGPGLVFRNAVSGTGEMTFDRTGPLPGFGTPVVPAVAGTLEVGSVGSGQTVAMIGNDTLILDNPASFAGTISGFGAGDTIDLTNIASGGASLSFIGGTLSVTSGGAAANLHFAGAYLAGDFTLGSDAGAGTLVTITPGVTGAGANFRILDTTTDTPSSDSGQAYTGPVSYLQQQYLWSRSDGVNVTSAAPNVFLKGGPGSDALQVTGGSNVLDGGTGSDFLVGSTGSDGGTDTFFVDGRGGATTWSTAVNFHHGDAITFWGFDGAQSTYSWTANDGAQGYQGATIHAATAGAGTPVNASLTFAGMSMADAQSKLAISTGSVGGENYMYVKSVG